MTTFEVTRNGKTFDLNAVHKALLRAYAVVAYWDAFNSELAMQDWPGRKVSPLAKNIQQAMDSLVNFRYKSDLPEDDEGV